jgi:SAM-dependent methyltransferase
MAASSPKDLWTSGNAYEPYVGRWSRLVANHFVGWLSISIGLDWLDVGCGTGALTETILGNAGPRRVLGVDPSFGFIAYAKDHVTDPRASFQVADAQALPLDNDQFDATVSGLVINFVPDQRKAVDEMARVTRPAGTVAAYVWDYAGEMQMMRRFWDAAIALKPAAEKLDEGVRFPVCRPEALHSLFSSAGLANVLVRAVEVPTVFRDFDDYWTPFLSGQAPAPGYCMSLSEEDRRALREGIRRSLPIREDGSIHLIARAWAARGVKAER